MDTLRRSLTRLRNNDDRCVVFKRECQEDCRRSKITVLVFLPPIDETSVLLILRLSLSASMSFHWMMMMMMNDDKHGLRKCVGVLFLLLEMNLLGGTIFGFPSLFRILSTRGIYRSSCPVGSASCDAQIEQYQVSDLALFSHFEAHRSMFVRLEESDDTGHCFF